MTRQVTRHLSPCIAGGWLVALLLLTGCSNILRSGLVNDTSILLPPSTARTIYVQIRNTSENQHATPADIPARLMAKGYQVVNDPLGAAYWLQTQVVYCHKAGEGVRPEMVAKAGFGAGIGSGGTPLANAGGLDMDAMGGMFGGSGSGGVNMQALRGMAMGGGAAPDLNAMMRMAMSGRGGYPGMAPPEQNHRTGENRPAATLQNAISGPRAPKEAEHRRSDAHRAGKIRRQYHRCVLAFFVRRS